MHSIYSQSKSVLFVVFINFFVSCCEIVGGLLSGSLLLVSDALHNLSDSMSAIFSYIAITLSRKKADKKYTFGYARAEILAAFVNSGVLFIVTLYIIYEAILRLISPNKILPVTMLIFALVSFIGNLLSTIILYAHSKSSINMKSTYLHMLGDAVGSFSVIVGAVLIMYLKIYRIDSILTIAISIYLLKESVKLIIKSAKILMEASPDSFDLDEIKNTIQSISEVKNVHHIHTWSISDRDIFLELHIELEDIPLEKTEIIKQKVQNLLKEKGVTHVNIQFETKGCSSKSILCEEQIW
ncbi:cation diffusion facilitator family transporter [Desulfurella sp.]|uniref:cation diffusion facilitator family transporter n=1 Tax=Desulfurella sp. TaxID=1962857 RepID=UPI0025BE2B6A|nr:cation diffusion facilitator family transporter [Desulfurella sp.]